MELDQIFIARYVISNGNPIGAMGLKDGRLVAKGERLEEIGLTNPVSLVDLGDKTVLPGFIDAHMHLLMYCWKKHHEVDLSGINSIEDLETKVRQFIQDRQIKAGTWLVGSGWNQELFKDKKMPSRYDLDRISKEHPILLNRTCYHICAVNSLALEMAGLSISNLPVEGGFIDLDDQGIPTGILRENAVTLARGLIPKIKDKALMKSLIISGCRDLAKVGITTVHTDDFEFVGDKTALLEAYMDLAKNKELPIRVVLQLRVSSADDVRLYKGLGLESWTDIGYLRIGPAKIIADGSLGSRTAALSSPYSDDKDNSGILIYKPEDLDDIIQLSLESGLDIAVHAIGDRTMSLVLDSYEKHLALIRKNDCRPSIIHCQIASKEILRRMKASNIIANIQPIFLNTDWTSAESRVGSQRLIYSYCWKTYLKYGIHCAGSSDAPIEDFNPLFGIHCGVTRTDLKNQPAHGWYPNECLSLDEGIGMFTYESAYASKEEGVKGQLEPGFYGDFIVLDQNPYVVDKSQIKDIKVLQTYVAGKLVYDGEKVNL